MTQTSSKVDPSIRTRDHRETARDTQEPGPTRDRPQHQPRDVILAVQSPNRLGFPPPNGRRACIYRPPPDLLSHRAIAYREFSSSRQSSGLPSLLNGDVYSMVMYCSSSL